MNENKKREELPPAYVSPLPYALRYGLLMGAGSAAILQLLYAFHLPLESPLFYLPYLIYGACITLAIQNYRARLHGVISFRRAAACGTLTSVFAAAVMAVYSYFLYAFLQPELGSQILAFEQQQLAAQGMSDEEVSFQIETARALMTPAKMAVVVIPATVLTGMIISLITAFFLKKK